MLPGKWGLLETKGLFFKAEDKTNSKLQKLIREKKECDKNIFANHIYSLRLSIYVHQIKDCFSSNQELL